MAGERHGRGMLCVNRPLADTREEGERESVTSKEVYFVDNISNGAGHKEIDCEY